MGDNPYDNPYDNPSYLIGKGSHNALSLHSGYSNL